MIDTYYSTLGVDKSATIEEIKLAFYRLASEHHPDRGGDAEVMAKINVAYNMLIDPKSRGKYDDMLALIAEPCPKCEGSGRRWKQKGFSARVATVCADCGGNGYLKWLHKAKPKNTVINMGGPATKRRRK